MVLICGAVGFILLDDIPLDTDDLWYGLILALDRRYLGSSHLLVGNYGFATEAHQAPICDSISKTFYRDQSPLNFWSIIPQCFIFQFETCMNFLWGSVCGIPFIQSHIFLSVKYIGDHQWLLFSTPKQPQLSLSPSMSRIDPLFHTN